ncbi:MAG: tetratricopeptide repeat protein [Planctomycetes bacterium]|nr:tetratricopeptide repeat protein [Planctomycetota bacterium]
MSDLLNRGIWNHQQGRLQEAERIYREILQQTPENPDALHLLGVLMHQRGDHAQAVDWINRAISAGPNQAAFHCNIAEAYRSMGRHDDAVKHCREALRLQPQYPEALNNLGLALLDSGKAEESQHYFEEATALQPNFAMAWNNLGNACRERDDWDRAIESFRKAVNLAPNLYHAHSNLGQALLEQGKLDEALRHCQIAVNINPGFPEAHNNLGNVLREMGKLPEARAAYNEAMRLQPNLAMAYNNMGQAAQEEGKFDEAITWYKRAMSLDPNSARFHANLASVYHEQENEEAAIAEYEMGIRLDPDHPGAHNGLAHVYQDMQRHQEAREYFEKAIALKPDLVGAHASLGHLYAELGDFDKSVACFEEAIKQDPDIPGGYAGLATQLKGKVPDEHLTKMEEFLKDEYIQDGARAAIHFGLGQIYDARKEYDKAQEHLEQGNTLQKKAREKRNKLYDPNAHTQYVDRLMETFTPDFFAKRKDWGHDSTVPIFIVGMPRSGTTLTEQILASHPKVFGAGELRLVHDGIAALPARLRTNADDLDCVVRATPDMLKAVAEEHLQRLRRYSADAGHITDKMPDNYLWLGWIVTLFPKAKVVYVKRDVRDIAVSCWMTSFRMIRWANDMNDIARRIADHERIMAHWAQVVPDRYLVSPYEDLVDNPEEASRRLLDWCGLEWNEKVLEFHKHDRPVRTASVSQVRQPIYKTSVQRWKRYEKALGPVLEIAPAPEPDDATPSEKI